MLAVRTRPIQWLAAYGLMLLFMDSLDLPLPFMKSFLPVTLTCWLLLAFWAGHNLIDLGLEIYNNRPGKTERASLRDLMAPTVTLVLKTLLVFFFGYWLISLLGNPDLLTQILAGMGIVGLAVSLAAQDAIKHFFGTLLLISEGPFKIGDRIIIDKYKGVVEVCGFPFHPHPHRQGNHAGAPQQRAGRRLGGKPGPPQPELRPAHDPRPRTARRCDPRDPHPTGADPSAAT